MGKKSRLLLIESVIPTGNEFHPGKFLDYIMLLCFGGQERTEEELESLSARGRSATHQKVVPTGSHLDIIEAVPS
jgi:hypothetical protein